MVSQSKMRFYFAVTKSPWVPRDFLMTTKITPDLEESQGSTFGRSGGEAAPRNPLWLRDCVLASLPATAILRGRTNTRQPLPDLTAC